VRFFLRHLALALALLTGVWLHAAERIPPAPAQYFNDYTGTVSPTTASTLNRQLEQYERDSSNQLLVVIYPKMETDSSVEDFTIRVAQSWKAGQKGKNNGAVLFVFKADHQLYIQVGYGLEPSLTDATCNDIIENILKPRFRSGNFDLGLSESVSAMIAATKGEFTGTGRTHADSRAPEQSFSFLTLLFVAIPILMLLGRGWRLARNPSIFMNPSRRTSTWWTSGGSSGGGSWGGGGGGFSGGGGSFGGGGAGGKW
jgi:uncharacterized protein